MRIMVTGPEDPAEREAITRQAAQIHAEAIRESLSGLRCPAAQKTALLHSISWKNQGQNGEESQNREHKLTK